MYYGLKILLSAIIIVVVSEISKFNAVVGGLIKSLPLISLLALIWLYTETHDTNKIVTLSISTFWFVLPTLPMFLVLPFLLHRGVNFYLSLIASIAVMLICYLITMAFLKWFNVML